jgi:urease accessory protein
LGIARVNRLAPAIAFSEIAAGSGGLEVEMVAGSSALTSAWATSPLKLLVPRPRGESVWAYLSSFGGGMVAGDQTSLDVKVGDKARCFLSTQASTKVYRNPRKRPCSHSTLATLGEESLLALVPDPVQAFAGSTYSQRQTFHLPSSAGLVMVDWFCSGRAARGECWAFTRFQSRNEVFVDGQRLLVDSLLLDPADGSLTGNHRMGRFHCLALLLIVGAPFHAAVASLLAETGELPVTRRAALLTSASPVRNGALLRIAGENVEEVGREIRRHIAFLEPFLGDNPWRRKP